MYGAQKLALLLHACFVVICRGALFFPVCIDIEGHLFEVAGGRTSSQLLFGPAVLAGLIHLAMILDAIKDAMFCTTADSMEPTRPLRAASAGADEAAAMGETPDSSAARKPSRTGKSRSEKEAKPRKGKKMKGQRQGRGRGKGGVELDEEMTFGFADGSSYDNSLEDEYDDDADDDAATGDVPPATFRARHNNTSPFDGADRMPASSDFEAEKARLRKELEDARREMENNQQQQRDRRRAERDANARPTSRSTPSFGTPPVRPVAVETVNHAAIFATGVMPKKASHYAMLGVAKTAGADEIKKAYNKLAMKYHPDKNPEAKEKAELLFMGIKDAYECLSDPLKRRRYDR